ncbi:MAG: hypothetical protein VX733_12095 [Candidatus Latescibacterota bacterium]|nr:hypothetical protein [Candidatus Latescibacterota bacterium]
MPTDWLTGIYLTTDVVRRHPDYVTRLRDEIGLDTVVLSFTGEVPESLRQRSPYPGSESTDEELASLVLRHFDGRPVDPREYDRARELCGPGVPAAGDDGEFRAAVNQLKDAGLQVWTYGGAWTIRRLMFCPSRADVQDWLEAACVYWATEYDLDGLDITHFRYPMGSFPLGLFGCTCPSCRSAAADLGYDMDAMVNDLKAAREQLRRLDGVRLGEVVRLGIGFLDVVHALSMRSGVLDWFRFRCDLIVCNLARFRAAVRSASPTTRFGTDTYPASMALAAGHDYLRWDEMADFASPLVSHISAFVCNTFIEWARFLTEEVDGLSEADALSLVYRFTGYDGMGLPKVIADYRHEEAATLAYRIPTADLVIRDLAKARLLLPAGMPSYPIIHGEGWPRHDIDRIVNQARQLDHNGIVWQGTQELMPYDFNG